ncbi:MAG: FGGY-family carbohydrate kinase [Clostridia bacterium]
MENTYVLTYDIGTTGVKTCLFAINNKITLLKNSVRGYNLYVVENGGVEQDADEWWQAMCESTAEVMSESKISVDMIKGISFCSQMQGMVLVDDKGNAIRRPMSYMDQRGTAEIKKYFANGIKLAGANAFKLLKAMYHTGVAPASVKDPVWKYKWVEQHENDIFKKAYKWLDVKEYLICRCTGKFVMTEDSAFATLLMDKKTHNWSKPICKMLGVNLDHLAKIIKSTDEVGSLTSLAAKQLGLNENTIVFGGGGDASLIGLGSGCVEVGDTHIYSGTSGWVSTITDKQSIDIVNMVAGIQGAQTGKYNYFAEMETSGKCLEWVKNHLALDEINIYLKKEDVAESIETEYTSLYQYMTKVIEDVPAGSGGVIFTPWLHGNRCPFEDPAASGMFFNISLETGKTELIKAVLEGICYHKRWMLEVEAAKVRVSDKIKFVGGGALSSVTCQILADITGKEIETIDQPQNVGAVGAAAIVGVGLKIIDTLEKIKEFIPITKTYVPNKSNKKIYDKHFEVFKTLYKNNKKAFHILND